MGMPTDIGVFDTLIGLPPVERRGWQKSFATVLRDVENQDFDHPAGYMYRTVPQVKRDANPGEALLREMDRFGVEFGLVPVTFDDPDTLEAVRDHGDRLFGSYMIDPNRGVEGLLDMQRAVEDYGAVAAQYMPCGVIPAVPINDKRAYPVYAKCVELDIPIFVNGGVPGPRVPMDPQYPGLVDEVCWFFPDLRFVFRHCCEPWVDLTIKLLLKYPNLYYSTSGFAPKYYPREIIEYANSRGADKVMYGGYHPYGLDINRIFRELPDLPLKDEVWPKFLRENAARVLGVS